MTTPHEPRDVVGAVGNRTPRVLQIAAVLTLIGLGFMVWSMVQPTPMPVILAMSVGQGLGIVAFALYGVVVIVDQFRKQRAKGAQAAAPEPASLAGPPGAPRVIDAALQADLSSSPASREASP